MKILNRILILTAASALLVTATPAEAQHYIGVRGGVGAGTARFEPTRETRFLGNMPSGGVSWKYYSAVPVAGAIQLDVEYIEKGFKILPWAHSDTSYQTRTQNIQVPLIWQPHLYLFNRNARVFLNLGVYASYMLSADTATVSKARGVLYQGDYPLQKVKDAQWGYGLTGGLGFSVLMGRWDLLVEARYNYGYSDLYRNPNKYPTNPTRSPIDQLDVTVGLYYRLGKGGIIEPPLRKKPKNLDSDFNSPAPASAPASKPTLTPSRP